MARSASNDPRWDVISAPTVEYRTGSRQIQSFSDWPNSALALEARNCLPTVLGGQRTLELLVPRGGYVPLHATCVRDLGEELMGWTVRREWSALPADAWEAVIAECAPGVAAVVFD